MAKKPEEKKPEASPEQFSLDIFQLKPQILKKPVQAVHMGVIDGSMTRTQRLMWNAMLKNAHDGTSRDGIYSIHRSELMDMIDYTSPNRKHFKDTLMQMQKISVQWDVLSQDGNEMWASCILLPTVAMDKEHVYYSYSPQIKPMLFDPKIFARIDLRIQRQLRLDCATALFEWCVRYRSVKKTVVMPWTEWRWAIYGSIDATSTLNQYKYFKKDKLLPAIREINLRSDVTIELIEIKDGRRVADLQFTVQEKPIFVVTDENRKKTEEWDSRLEAWGIKERDRVAILAKYSHNVLEAHYQYTVKRLSDASLPQLRNVGSYFKNALENQRAKDQVKSDSPKNDGQTNAIIAGLLDEFNAQRNKEAEGYFNEVPADMQKAFVEEFNDGVADQSERINFASMPAYRHLISFYKWLANKVWGPASDGEILGFALKHGAIKSNS